MNYDNITRHKKQALSLSLSYIFVSDTPLADFEPEENVSSDFVELICAQ